MTGFYNLVFYGIYEYTTIINHSSTKFHWFFDECLFFKLAIKNLIDIIFFHNSKCHLAHVKKKTI